MSELKIYDVTGKEVGTHDVRINNEVNFKDYQKQYGRQRAEGYADCLRDLFLELEHDVIHDPKKPVNTFRSNNSTIKCLHQFYSEKSALLQAVAKTVSRPSLLAETYDEKYKHIYEEIRKRRESPTQE